MITVSNLKQRWGAARSPGVEEARQEEEGGLHLKRIELEVTNLESLEFSQKSRMELSLWSQVSVTRKPQGWMGSPRKGG